MLNAIPALLLAIVLFIGINLSYVAGVRLRLYRFKTHHTPESEAWGPFVGAVLGLLALLLAFTFNQSATHYDTQRDLLVSERNAIVATMLRADLYPDSLRREFRHDLREFVRARIAYFDAGSNEDSVRAALKEAELLTNRLWQRTARSANDAGGVLRSSQMIPQITTLMDNMIRREEARRRHVPDPVLWLLFLLSLTGSFIIGYAGKSGRIDWVILGSYALMTVMTIYLILDLDRPQRGMIETRATHENIRVLLGAFQDDQK